MMKDMNTCFTYIDLKSSVRNEKDMISKLMRSSVNNMNN